MDRLSDVVDWFINRSKLKEFDITVLRHLLASTLVGKKKAERAIEFKGETREFHRDAIYRIREDVKRVFDDGKGFTIEKDVYTLRLPLQIPTFAPIDDFSRLLYAMCRVAGIEKADRTTKFQKWLAGDARGTFSGLATALRRQGIHTFDDVFRQFKQDRNRISVDDMRVIADDIFDFHSLLLYPLLVPYDDTGSLALDLNDFVDIKRIQSKDEKGPTAAYSSPTRRLQLADATIGLVRLDDAHPHSDPHTHPGDEIALMLSGSIDFQLRQAGNRINLKEGDLIHFYAETSHQAFKHGKDPATMLVIRFYQTDAPTRHVLWSKLKDHLTRNPSGPLPRHAAAWILQALPSYLPRNYQPVVADELGLARLLDTIAQWKPGEIEGSSFSAEKREALQSADPSAMSEITSLQEIAKAYGIEEFLLRGFGFPAVSDKVILQRTRTSASAEGTRSYTFESSDFYELPDPKVKYRLPRRSLSCSDISIAHIELAPDGGTPPNSHPGLELIYLESGSLRITVEGSAEVDISATGPQICHFDSSHRHIVANSGSDTAKFWVIRFYRDGVPRGEPSP